MLGKGTSMSVISFYHFGNKRQTNVKLWAHVNLRICILYTSCMQHQVGEKEADLDSEEDEEEDSASTNETSNNQGNKLSQINFYLVNLKCLKR